MAINNFGFNVVNNLCFGKKEVTKLAIDYLEDISAKQQDIYNSVLKGDCRRLAICGSPGAGKTTIGVPTALDVPMSNREAGLFVGTSTPAIRDLLNQWFRENTDGFHINPSQMSFRFNNKLYYLAGADNDTRTASFKGKNIKVVYVEEITHPKFNRAIYDEILDRLRGRIKWDYKSYVILSFNPTTPSHWVYNEIFCSSLYKSYTMTIFDNEAIDHEAFIQGRGFLTKESRQTTRYDWLILGHWAIHDEFPFNKLEYVTADVGIWQFAFVDPSLKGKDKSAITFFARNDKGDWLVKGFCDNLAVEAFLKQGKLQNDLDKCSLVVLEENVIGHFKSNLELALGRELSVYHTTSNKINKIKKLILPIMNGEIKFLDTCEKVYLSDIQGWQIDVKEQCDDAVDSLAAGLEMWGVL